MTTYSNAVGQKAESKRFLNRLSRRTKILGVGLLVFLGLLLISVPGDRTQLLARQERVDAAQIAYALALPAVAPVMESSIAFLDESEVDLSDNRLYTGLASALTGFNRANASVASRAQSIITFSRNVHLLGAGDDAVPELDTDEFRAAVAELDTTLSVAWIALMELNEATDEYNGYHTWLSASLAGAAFGLPQGYADPISANSRFTSESLAP